MRSTRKGSSVAGSRRRRKGAPQGSYPSGMGFEAAPFDVVEASRRVWLERWEPEAASGMAVYTSILRSYQLLNDQVTEVMRSHDLTFARYQVLAWLATDPESALTLSWISKTLRIPPATVTDIIDRLEDEKLVRREPHPSDARTTLAVITARGRRVATDATDDLNVNVYERIGLSERQRTQLVDLLAGLRVSGNEFDAERSNEVIEELGSREARKAGASCASVTEVDPARPFGGSTWAADRRPPRPGRGRSAR
jgi:DNA-binding MarR family transcriptional regulator